MIEVVDLLLYGAEASWFPAFITDTENRAEFFIELCNGNGGERDILHMMQAWIKLFCKTSQAK